MATYPDNAQNLGQTVNNSGRFAAGQPLFLVMHYTAGGDGMGSARYLHRKHSPASSAHFVVDRNGDVIQISDTGVVTWHAGKSFWRGLSGLNSRSIGIEIANFGFWRKEAGLPNSAVVAKGNGWLEAPHRNGGPAMLWEPYPEVQLAAVDKLTRWILKTHPTIREIVGHDEISPGRKFDPGPAFPMQRFRDILNPRSTGSVVPKEVADDDVTPPSDQFKVNVASLNVRGGPGTNFGVVAGLVRNAKVTELAERGEWTYISFTRDRKKREGWVFTMYLTPA